MEKDPSFIRPENLIEALGIDFKNLDAEEEEMKKLLIEEYKKRQKSVLMEVKKWRENKPQATLGEAIRALYQELEDKE